MLAILQITQSASNLQELGKVAADLVFSAENRFQSSGSAISLYLTFRGNNMGKVGHLLGTGS